VFEFDADALTADQVSLTANPDPARFRNVLDVDGASLIVELLAGTLEPGDAFDLVDESNVDQIVGTPLFQFPYGEWDRTSFASDGRVTFLSGSIDPPDEMPQTAWNKPGGGNWNEPTNWDAGVPNAVGDIAIFNGTAPTTSATITIDAPVQVEGIESASPRTITIAGPGALTFAAGAEGAPHIGVTAATGGLTIGTPVKFPGATLTVAPERATTAVRLDGGISADSGDTIKNGQGSLVLAGDSSDWSGALIVNSGRVEAAHANAFGAAVVPTTIAGGRVDVKSSTLEPFVLQEGSLRLAMPAGQITLGDGAVYVENDVPLDFVVPLTPNLTAGAT
jgi:autotransporter-associated beta strand protein